VSLVFLLGGARSGKSSLAVRLAGEWSGPVTVVATAEASDDEMAERIRLHQAERPPEWETIEEPLDLELALQQVADDTAVVIDCISLWVSNLLARGDADSEVEAQARSVAARAVARPSLTIAVSNEVGLGIVPATELGRRYRDVLGRANSEWAAAADQAALVVAGRLLSLTPHETSL
jgi:adenosylcobinamide kinase/adenosylcobinamide-phosphate guanylyltransferase